MIRRTVLIVLIAVVVLFGLAACADTQLPALPTIAPTAAAVAETTRDSAVDPTTAPAPTVAPPTETATPLPPTPTLAPTATPTPTLTPTPTGPERLTYRVLNTFPHDPDAWTQGLVIDNGVLYEGTGQWGASSLREVVLETGTVLRSQPLDDQYYGEGITVFGDRIIQLTWQENTGFVYDRSTFELLQTFTYPTEGWGVTQDGQRLIVSDGTATLYFWDPETLTEIGRVLVTDQNGPVNRLNELEYIDGEVYANIWLEDRIARIDPETGEVSAAGRHRHRQNLHHRQRDPADAAAHAHSGAQQDPGGAALQRIQAVLSPQRRQLLCELLRLLPAGSLHPAHRNDEIGRLRLQPHRPTLSSRRDVVIVASVSGNLRPGQPGGTGAR
jgi:glutaminyl-peptide cyclotransferase